MQQKAKDSHIIIMNSHFVKKHLTKWEFIVIVYLSNGNSLSTYDFIPLQDKVLRKLLGLIPYLSLNNR